jgi:hypothetical protein
MNGYGPSSSSARLLRLLVSAQAAAKATVAAEQKRYVSVGGGTERAEGRC